MNSTFDDNINDLEGTSDSVRKNLFSSGITLIYLLYYRRFPI